MTDYLGQVRGEFAPGIAWSFGMRITSSQTLNALLTTWANAWNSAWTDGTHGLQTLYPVTTKINEYQVSTLNGIYEQTAKVVQGVSHPGTSAADTLPFQEAVVISLRSSTLGRHARGRFFLPAMAEDVINGDVVIGTAATRIKAAVESVRSAINADGSTIFVVDIGVPHPTPPAPVVPPGPKFVIDQPFLVNTKPSRQSRRVRKIRPVYV